MDRLIMLTRGRVAIVDDVDYELVRRHKWHASVDTHTSYAMSMIDGKHTTMHRFLMGDPPDGMEIDHANHNGLDNRRSNIRFVTRTQNHSNRRKKPECSSRFKGVIYQRNRDKLRKRWRAVIRIPSEGRLRHLGYFETEIEAAEAYNSAAFQYYGEFVLLNEVA